jgi:hypothetical protein
MFAIIGGHLTTTSGAMELAAALECILLLCRDPVNSTTALCISDYLTWVEARLSTLGYDNFRGKKNLPTWVAILASLMRWGGDDDVLRALHRVHVRSHVVGARSWGQEVNEVADKLAAEGKAMAISGAVRPWTSPPIRHSPCPRGPYGAHWSGYPRGGRGSTIETRHKCRLRPGAHSSNVEGRRLAAVPAVGR